MVEKDNESKIKLISRTKPEKNSVIKPLRARDSEPTPESKSKTFPNPKPFKLENPDGTMRDVFVHGIDAQSMIATISENKRPPFQQVPITFFELSELLHL